MTIIPILITVGILLGVLIVVGLFVMVIYNGLVSARVDTDNGWAQIDVQLKRRHDLIPNLVETVKGYASHESDTLEAVIAARTRAVAVPSGGANAGQASAAEGELTQALGRLFAVAEAYPDLKASTNFSDLQEELSTTENKIGFARQHFNDVVGNYEVKRQSFPTVIIAGMFGFDKRDYFELPEGDAAREAPSVSFS